MPAPEIVVVGSANTDLTVAAERLPRPGETVLGGRLRRAAGGKGANQAVAAARAGAGVAFVGRVGADEFGRATVEGLRAEGIDTAFVRVDEHAPSGVALIMVDGRGENLIAVAPGANALLSPEDVNAAAPAIASAMVLLLQLEVPLPAAKAAVELARKARSGPQVVLNPAPAPAPDALEGILERVDCLTPNRGEAARLLGLDGDADPEQMARGLLTGGVGAVVMTLGAEGACVCNGTNCARVPAVPVEAVDTVGAGDCFAGALAAALSEGMSLLEATRFATCAAALSVQRPGAQPSMPTRAEIETLLAENQPLSS